MTTTLAHARTPLAALTLTLAMLALAAPTRTGASGSDDRPARPARAGVARPSDASDSKLKKTFARPRASFELNAGQADPRVRFIARGAGHTLLLSSEGATLALREGGRRKEGATRAPLPRAQGERAPDARDAAPSFRLVGMRFVGANPRAEVAGEGRLEGSVNYLVGRDPSKWRAGVPTYAGVRYRGLYPGVDLVYHDGAGDRLEYDFVLAPGADHRAIRLRFDGVNALSLSGDGRLLLDTGAGTISQSAPVVYQEARGSRREVAGRYVLYERNEVGFEVGAYDRALPLVIDPVLVYSSYVPYSAEMAVDAAGSVYLVGTADGFADIPAPTPGAFQTVVRGDADAFVAKLNPEGTQLSYLTYIGGGSDGPAGASFEQGQDIAVDAAGNAYVTGLTSSRDFPVVGAFQPASGGGGSEGFVAKLNPQGSALVYSSYLGGSATEWSKAIAVDAAGAAYVFGETFSPDFPVVNALQPALKGFDFFVTKVAPSGSTLEYSTYLGGSDMESGFLGDIAVDAAGAAYVAGTSYSFDYPVTPGAFQPAIKTGPGHFNSDIVVTKIAPGGGALVYSTYLGGANVDFCHGLAVDAAGQAHVVGSTNSTDFPLLNPLYSTPRDPYGSGFLTKLNAAGTGLVYSTYVGGTPKFFCGQTSLSSLIGCGGEAATGVATDPAGNAYVTGNTISENFPAPVNALQPQLDGQMDAFVIKLTPAGQALYSTYLGGSSSDDGAEVHTDASGTAYVLGTTSSDDLPVVNPYRDSFAREFDTTLFGFVAKLSDADADPNVSRVRLGASAYAVGEGGGSVEVTVTREGGLAGALEVGYSTGDATASERADYTTARGSLRFAPGESSKSFAISVIDDHAVEGDETFALTLHNLRGPAVLASPASAVVTVADNDERPSAVNPIDSTQFFVRQHYLDFLSREPDADGLAFWTNEIESCGADAACREVKRVNVSAAFFLSIEHQETGFLVARLYRLAFAAQVPYRSFVHDSREVGGGLVVGPDGWQQRLAANQRAYAESFVARAPFREEFPESLTAAQYVEKLNARASGALSPSEFNALVAGLEAGTETRATVLLKVADDADFRAREFAPAFVLVQYLGYLRRNPADWPDDGSGYNFWLAKLNSFGGDWRAAEMVKAFLDSAEYRRRFHEPAKEVALGSPFTLGLGELALVQPDRLRVSLLDVSFDSRCPRGSQCPFPGSVSILLQAVQPGGVTARFVLSIQGGAPRPHPSNPPAEALGYKFRLLQFDPEPPHGPAPPNFQALIQVDKN